MKRPRIGVDARPLLGVGCECLKTQGSVGTGPELQWMSPGPIMHTSPGPSIPTNMYESPTVGRVPIGKNAGFFK